MTLGEEWEVYRTPDGLEVVWDEWTLVGTGAPEDFATVLVTLDRIARGPDFEPGVVLSYGIVRYLIFKSPTGLALLVAWRERQGNPRSFQLLQVAGATDPQLLPVPPLEAQVRAMSAMPALDPPAGNEV